MGADVLDGIGGVEKPGRVVQPDIEVGVLSGGHVDGPSTRLDLQTADVVATEAFERHRHLGDRRLAQVDFEQLVVAHEELDGPAVGVSDDDVHLAAGGVHEALQGGEEHVAAPFEAGDLGLVHVE